MDSTLEPGQRYRITVRYKHISEEEADLKKRAIANVITEAMRRESHTVNGREGS